MNNIQMQVQYTTELQQLHINKNKTKHKLTIRVKITGLLLSAKTIHSSGNFLYGILSKITLKHEKKNHKHRTRNVEMCFSYSSKWLF